MQDCTAPSPTARGFFALDSGCALVLRELTLRNGKASGSGSANKDGANLDASCVAFGGNSATYVRAALPCPLIEMRTEPDAPLPSRLLALTTRHAMRRL